ncbi:uncharacterized protein LOC116253333 isoform X2 [Nymphaea colorata]|nr:uncharacterized protein LOC116253333 isoform X2 [Nymphaea colorata]
MQVRSGMRKQKKFLLVGDKVEVRQLEEGLRGSWQTGSVIGFSENTRVIRYDHFVDEDGITNCVERVAVSGTIGGAPSSSARVPSAYAACGHRGRIRPSVPPFVGPRPKDFWYGLCVDALYEDGWWEGVVFDNKVGSGDRSVFFPDEGDEVRFNVDRLRLTRDWDQVSGTWTARGTWAFLALVNELTDGTAASAPLWVKQLWYNLRSTDGFLRRISEWTLGEPSLWRTLMNKAVSDHTSFRSGTCSSRWTTKSSGHESDSICSICHYGGFLILCDQCPSSFHLDCVNLKEPPKGKWFCPCCRCTICGSSDFSVGYGEFSELSVLHCDQCEREYHVGCWRKREGQRLVNFPIGSWFCSRKCSKIFNHLHKIMGKPNLTPVNGLSWTILRYVNDSHKNDNSVSETMIEFQNKISIALDVLHECFLPVIEDRTGSDVVSDILFNRSSDLNRLNFRGFYTMLLEKGDELISVAVIRIHGEKVAEMPLVGTRVQYRRQGMCHLLMSELENMLSALGVERLILPAASQLKDTWIQSFGFMQLTSEEKFQLLGFTFLDFQDTIMCQKLLSPIIRKNPQGITPESCLHATKTYWQAQTGERAFHAAGAYSVEATENCFQRKTPGDSSMRKFQLILDVDLGASMTSTI